MNLPLRHTRIRTCRRAWLRPLLPGLLLCLLVSACGQRGPLYLPEAEDATPPPASGQPSADHANGGDDGDNIDAGDAGDEGDEGDDAE